MRIAFIVDAFPVLSETFVLNQITGLIDRGHGVEIFAGCRPADNNYPPEVEKYGLLKRTYYHNDKPRNVIIRIIKAMKMLFVSFHKGPLVILKSLNFFKYGGDALSLSLFYKVILFLNAGKFDIIHCHFGTNGNIGALLKEVGIKCKLVTMFHGYDIRLGIKEGGSIYNRLFNCGDLFLSISRYNYDNLVAFGADPNKIVTHPVGIDIKEFPFNETKNITPREHEVVRILTVGRLSREKGLAGGMKTIKVLTKRYPGSNLEYRIIGSGDLGDELKIITQKLGLEGVVHFLGAMQHKEVIRELGESDIFFLPSEAEALPVVLMEAQAMGLPIVATSVGSVSEIVIDGKSGFIVPEKDIDGMVDKVGYLIDHRNTWLEMGRVGRKHIEENYDVNVLNDKLVELYKELTKDG